MDIEISSYSSDFRSIIDAWRECVIIHFCGVQQHKNLARFEFFFFFFYKQIMLLFSKGTLNQSRGTVKAFMFKKYLNI